MKKVLATTVMLFVILMSGNVVYATMTPKDLAGSIVMTPADLMGEKTAEENDTSVLFSNSAPISSYMDFDDTINSVEQCAIERYNSTGESLVWTVSSMNKHKELKLQIYSNKNSETYKELVNTIDNSYDFVQSGFLLKESDLEQTKFDFNEDSTKAFLNATIETNDSKKEELYNQIKLNNVPVYWNIVETDCNCFILEVALGKYNIKQGDTLSEIAQSYQTTIERLLENNSQIENPDLIYAGDYLAIK